MRGSTNTWTRALGAAAAACVALAAHASPGDGIRLGGADSRLHPYFDLETRYDSNVAYSGQDPVADLIVHVRPGLELKMPGDAAAIEFNGALDWAQYLGLNDKAATPASGATPASAEVDTKSLSRLYATASLAAAFNRNGSVAPRIDNTFTRQVSTASLAAVGAPVVSNLNKLSLSLPWRPAGGALVLVANGEWTVESFEKYRDLDPSPVTSPATSISDLGYAQYRAGGEVQWRFLPRTSGVLQASYYQRTANVADQAQNANGFDVTAGLVGLLTERVATTAKVGWGSATAGAFTYWGTTFAPGGTNYAAQAVSSFLADLAVEWLPVDALSLRAGYKRSLGLDPIYSVMTQDSVSGVIAVKLAERYAFRVGGHWDKFGFKLQLLDGASATYVSVDPTLEARLGRWFTGGLGYVYSTRTAAAVLSQPTYSKNEVFLRLGVTY
jgi:hypothetical protein